MTELGNGLSSARHDEDALSVREAELAVMRRLGGSEGNMLALQSNLANTYEVLGRYERALQMQQAAYSGRVRLNGEEHEQTLRAADNYALSLLKLRRFEEAKALLRKTIPIARRVLGNNHDITLRMIVIYTNALYDDPGATLDDLREAVTTLEEAARTSRRVLGGNHPITLTVENSLRESRAALRAGETPSTR